MKQICRFSIVPPTVNNGGNKGGAWIVWLNIGTSVSEDISDDDTLRYTALTDRLILNDNTLSAFLNVVDLTHLSTASNVEIQNIMRYFQVEDDIESWKAIRKAQIQGYYSDSAVNQFYVNDTQTWFDKANRVGLVNLINFEKTVGKQETSLWLNDDVVVSMKLDAAFNLLLQLELYARECYNVTALHMMAVKQAQTIQELQDFDITADYPDVLRFTV